MRWLLAAALAICSAAAQAQGFQVSSPTPVPNVSVSSCTAPCPVFVRLDQSTDASTFWPYHERYYSTNFDATGVDPGYGNWTDGYGSSNSVLTPCTVPGTPQTTYCGFMVGLPASLTSKNIGIGPEVGHVYRTAGVYSIVTTMTGPYGSVQSAAVTVTVNNPNDIYGGTWSGGNCTANSPAIGCTVCIGAAFTNCPGGASNNDPKSAGIVVAAIANTYLTATSGSHRVLLHATESLDTGAAQTISSGTYNTGTRTVTLTLAAPAQSMQVGDTLAISGLTGTGAFASLEGNFASASVSGSTVTYVTPTNVGAATITGGTMNVGGVLVQCSSCQIGSFDTGAQPIIQSKAIVTSTVASSANVIIGGLGGAGSSNLSVHDVQVDAVGDNNACFNLPQNSKRFLTFNVTCTNSGSYLGSSTPTNSSAVVDEVYINSVIWHGSGSTTGDQTKCGLEVVFFRGVTRLSVLGSVFEMADSMSQSMTRLQTWNEAEVGWNIYGRPCPGRAGIDLRGDTSPQAGGPVIYDKFANIHHNVLWANGETGGGGNPLIVNEPQSSPQDYGIQDILVESNACWMGITSSHGCINTAEASNVTWRNNIVNGILRAAGNTVAGYALIWDMDTPFHPQPQNIWAYFNAYNCNTNNITTSGSGMFHFEEQYVPGTSFFKNNLQFCVQATSAPVVTDSGSSSVPVKAGNSDQVSGGGATVNPMWSNGSGGYSLYSDYAVGLSNYKSVGVAAPVWFDFAGKAVPQTTPTLGPLQ
jgi:hypothetical protein